MSEVLQRFTPPREGKRPRQLTLALIISGVLAAGCSSPTVSSVDANPYPTSPPATEQPYNSLPSAKDTLDRLINNKKINQEMSFMDLSYLRTHYSEDKFEVIDKLSYSSAPLIEFTYDRATQSIRFQDKTPNGLSDQDLYNFLSQVVNNVELNTAFKTGAVDRVSLRLGKEEPDTTPEYLRDRPQRGKFVIDDKSDRQKGTQKSIFLKVPHVIPYSMIYYKNVLSHESLHALTANHPLSNIGVLEFEIPESDKLAQWQQVCVDLRNIAIDEAEKQSQGILQAMRENRHLLTDDPEVLAAYDQVYNDLLSGNFNKYQGDDYDLWNSILYAKTKVPECMVVGPWDAFVRLMHERNIDKDKILNVRTRMLAFNFSERLVSDWSNVIGNQTIYENIREGPYNEFLGTGSRLSGHSQDNWDELITSTGNLLLNYPDHFLQNIQKLPSEEQRRAVFNLIKATYETLEAHVPQDQKEFHAKLKTNYENFVEEMKRQGHA